MERGFLSTVWGPVGWRRAGFAWKGGWGVLLLSKDWGNCFKAGRVRGWWSGRPYLRDLRIPEGLRDFRDFFLLGPRKSARRWYVPRKEKLKKAPLW